MKSIDRQFKETFINWEVKPDAAIWERIATQLPPKPAKRRPNVWWWFTGFLSLGLVLFLWLLLLETVRPTVDQNAQNSPDFVTPKLPAAAVVELPKSGNDLQTESTSNHATSVPVSSPSLNQPISEPLTNTLKQLNPAPSATLAIDQDFSISQMIPPESEITTPIATQTMSLLPSILPTWPSSTGPDCPGFENNRSGGLSGGWQLDVFGGPGYAFRTLTAKSSEGTAYLAARNREEHPVIAYMAGARAAYYQPWGQGRAVGLKSGLAVARIVEKLAYSRDSVIGVLTTIVIDSQLVNGAWVINRDTVTSPRLGHLDRTLYNRFTVIEIPVLLSVQWNRGPWLWQINGGASFQLAYQKRGSILDPADNLVSLNDNTTNQSFGTQWGTQLWASVGLHRQISQRLYLFAEPTIRYQLKSLTSPTNLLDQRYMQAHLNLGAKIIF